MDNNDLQKFSEIMIGIAEATSSNISDAGLMLYFKVLEKYTIEQVEKAAVDIAKTRKYTKMPTPADFIEILDGTADGSAGTIQGILVWQSMHRHGKYSTVVFQDKTTQAVINNGFGGWVTMCQETPAGDRKWFLMEFEKIYKAYKAKNITYTGYLLGISDAENDAGGYLDHIEKPIRIGYDDDEAGADIVMLDLKEGRENEQETN